MLQSTQHTETSMARLMRLQPFIAWEIFQFEYCEDFQAISRNHFTNILAMFVKWSLFATKSFAQALYGTIMGVAMWEWGLWWLSHLCESVMCDNKFGNFLIERPPRITLSLTTVILLQCAWPCTYHIRYESAVIGASRCNVYIGDVEFGNCFLCQQNRRPLSPFLEFTIIMCYYSDF